MGTGRRRHPPPEAPHRLFRGWQENTNSIFCEGSPGGPETVNGCLVLRTAGTPPRGMNVTVKTVALSIFALLLSASGGFLPLDKDLSWMTPFRPHPTFTAVRTGLPKAQSFAKPTEL